MPDTPFDSIEGAQEYVRLLTEALEEAQETLREELASTDDTALPERRRQALRLVDYKLGQLRVHLHSSSRILNDLRSLRRLLLGEREESD